MCGPCSWSKLLQGSRTMFEERMNRLFEAAGIDSDSALARVLGIQPPSVAGARKRGLIPGGWIEKIALDYNVTADWLLFGRGPMRVGTTFASSPQGGTRRLNGCGSGAAQMPRLKRRTTFRSQKGERLLSERGVSFLALILHSLFRRQTSDMADGMYRRQPAAHTPRGKGTDHAGKDIHRRHIARGSCPGQG